MATLQEFRQIIERQEVALQEVIADIQEIKQRVLDSGMTGAEEAELLSLIEGTATRLENLAAENPEVSPEEPNLEEEI